MTKSETTYLVADVSRMTGISVRALHYYDEIGILTASGRTPSGYRIYNQRDLLRLQQILIGRELGMTLKDIRRSLDDPNYDQRAALVEQRKKLTQRAQQTATMLQAIDLALEALDHPSESESKLAALFDGFRPEMYEAETEQRWGDTQAFAESARRTRNYTEADWLRYRQESNQLMTEAAELSRVGTSSDSPETAAMVERHRTMIDQWFYPCDRAMHAQLAALYESDQRFQDNIDKFAPGLTTWLVAGIREHATG